MGMQSYRAVIKQILPHVLLTGDIALGGDTRCQPMRGLPSKRSIIVLRRGLGLRRAALAESRE
jgi:hypothetical protein